MAGSTFGTQFKITTWGESHGAGVGVVIDGCPAGLSLCENDIQTFLNRRKPGQSRYSTPRREEDKAVILSGTFEGKTTGTPLSIAVYNENQRSRDYGDIANCYRPGHADYTFDAKYGFRDYRGGGRSSGRETIGRVAAGAVASRLLEAFGISFLTYSKAIGPIAIPQSPELLLAQDREALQNTINSNPLYMPDSSSARAASDFLKQCMAEQNSAGGIIECLITGVPAGLGEPVFDKLDANLAKAIFSIGAVKGFEIGDGFEAARSTGRDNNDSFFASSSHGAEAASGTPNSYADAVSGNTAAAKDTIGKHTNHAGGILGGISDGSPVIFRAAIKPTPSISAPQMTVEKDEHFHEFHNRSISIKGRHDPIIVPRAVVVVEAMAALTLADLLLMNAGANMEHLKRIY